MIVRVFPISSIRSSDLDPWLLDTSLCFFLFYAPLRSVLSPPMTSEENKLKADQIKAEANVLFGRKSILFLI